MKFNNFPKKAMGNPLTFGLPISKGILTVFLIGKTSPLAICINNKNGKGCCNIICQDCIDTDIGVRE